MCLLRENTLEYVQNVKATAAYSLPERTRHFNEFDVGVASKVSDATHKVFQWHFGGAFSPRDQKCCNDLRLIMRAHPNSLIRAVRPLKLGRRQLRCAERVRSESVALF
jgi:hypothetical protein